MISLLCNLAC